WNFIWPAPGDHTARNGPAARGSLLLLAEKSARWGNVRLKESAYHTNRKRGVREWADDVFFALGIKRRRSKANFAPTWRRRRDLNFRRCVKCCFTLFQKLTICSTFSDAL